MLGALRRPWDRLRSDSTGLYLSSLRHRPWLSRRPNAPASSASVSGSSGQSKSLALRLGTPLLPPSRTLVTRAVDALAIAAGCASYHPRRLRVHMRGTRPRRRVTWTLLNSDGRGRGRWVTSLRPNSGSSAALPAASRSRYGCCSVGIWRDATAKLTGHLRCEDVDYRCALPTSSASRGQQTAGKATERFQTRLACRLPDRLRSRRALRQGRCAFAAVACLRVLRSIRYGQPSLATSARVRCQILPPISVLT